jgi:hypothetical protein
MDKQVEVTKLVIKIGEVEHSMSLDQARALKDALNSIFQASVITVRVPEHVPVMIPQPYPIYPAAPWRPWWTPTWISPTDDVSCLTLSATTEV